MSLVILPGVAGALVAVAAAAALWRGSLRPEPSVRNAYRWFVVATLLWGAGFVAQQATAASGDGTSLTFADLLTLLALPAIGIGLAGLAGQRREAGVDRSAPRVQARGAVAWLADACLMASALFVIAWLAVFGSEYHKLGESPGGFATHAVHPIADILALGVLLALAVRAGRAGLTPYLALFVVAVGESLAVGARISGRRPGPCSVIIQLAGFCLLGVSALATEPGEAPSRWRPGWPRPDVLPGATLLAALVAGVAAVMTIGWALAGESFAEPAVLASGGVAGLALVTRITELLRQERTAAAMAQESEARFRELAGRPRDGV